MGQGESIVDLGNKLTTLNTRWSQATTAVYDKHKILQEASNQYGEFRGKVSFVINFSGDKNFSILF